MKVNRKLSRKIRLWRSSKFLFWLFYYYLKNLPEIIYLIVYKEYLYAKIMVLSLLIMIKEILFPDE